MDANQPESPLFPPFDTCPGCDEVGLVPRRTKAGLAFQCPACSRCWHLDMGWVTEVDPVTGRHVARQEGTAPR